jgi:hypothetical protein
VVALRALAQRPDLAFVYDRGELEVVDKVTVSTSSDYIKLADGRHYLRLRVANRKRLLNAVCQTASEVQVIASTGSGPGRVGLDYRPLVWSSASPDPDNPVTALSIPTGVERHIDVVLLTDGPPPDARLLVWPKPDGHGDAIPNEDQVKVLLTLTCKEAPATFWEVVVKRDDAAPKKLDFAGAPKQYDKRPPGRAPLGA